MFCQERTNVHCVFKYPNGKFRGSCRNKVGDVTHLVKTEYFVKKKHAQIDLLKRKRKNNREGLHIKNHVGELRSKFVTFFFFFLKEVGYWNCSRISRKKHFYELIINNFRWTPHCRCCFFCVCCEPRGGKKTQTKRSNKERTKNRSKKKRTKKNRSKKRTSKKRTKKQSKKAMKKSKKKNLKKGKKRNKNGKLPMKRTKLEKKNPKTILNRINEVWIFLFCYHFVYDWFCGKQ